MPSAAEILTSLETVGFVIIRNNVNPDSLEPLREAAIRSRNKDWPHVRTVGKQFPPWPDAETASDVWGLQHISHPDFGEPIFGDWYVSDEIVDTVKTILGVEEEQLQMELCNMLVNPTHTAFKLSWHRDAIPAEASAEDEERMLKIPNYGTQWNTALFDDECLEVVPGSHRRVRTDEERAGNIEGIKVKLNAGDTVFYDHNILHRAVYPTSPVRLTLHACMGSTTAEAQRRQNILQHGMGWAKEAKFQNPRLEELRKRLVDVGGVQDAEEVGYSLSG